MLQQALAALLETPEGRRYFRVTTLVLVCILVMYLMTLLAIAAHRGYNNAIITVWGIVIGPGGGVVVRDEGSDASEAQSVASVCAHDLSFEWRTASQTWPTDAECEADLKVALAAMKLSDLDKNGAMFFGNTKEGVVLASCYGENLGSTASASVVSFGKGEDVRSSAASFLAMMSANR